LKLDFSDCQAKTSTSRRFVLYIEKASNQDVQISELVIVQHRIRYIKPVKVIKLIQ
jgi:hypothetical protein